MVRTLQVGDYIPDFVFRDANEQLHSASLAGATWVLLIFSDATTALANLPAINRVLAPNRTPVVVAAFGPPAVFRTGPSTEAPFAIGDDMWTLVFGESPSADGLSSCLVIERNLKISARIDNLEAPSALDEIVSTIQSQGNLAESGNALVPALYVPKALSSDFCAEIVDYFRASADKIQGRAGLSGAHLNMSVKRAVHVNVDNAFAENIDSSFIFSLLPAVERVFDYRVTHRQAYKVSCYDADQSGFFVAHRDNSDPGTLFRRFALSVALSDDWEGEGICFPEYSDRAVTLRVGDAVVFPVSLLHRVGPIISGQRFVLLSFLYDRSAAQLRRSTLSAPELVDGIYNDRISDDALFTYAKFAPVSRFSPQYELLQSAAVMARIGAVPD